MDGALYVMPRRGIKRLQLRKGLAMYSWRNWPLKEEPLWKSLLLAFLIAGAAFTVSFGFDETASGIVSFVLLALSLGKYWVPSYYLVDENGISIKRLWFEKKRSWQSFRRVVCDDSGIFLGVSDRPSPLDSFRGESINCPEKVTEIYEFAKRKIR